MCSGCTECHYIQHCSGVSGSIRVNTMGWNIAGRWWPCDHGAQPELTHPFNPDPGPGLGDTMHHGNMVWPQPWSDNDPISVTQICNCYQAQFTPSQIGKLQWGSKKWQHFSHRNHPAIQWSWVEMDLWVVLCASVRTLVCVIMNWSPFLALWHCHTNTSLIMYQRLSELVIQIKPGPWVAVHFSFTQISNPPWLQAAPLVPHCAMQCAPFNALTVKHSHLHTHFRYKTPKQEFYEFHCGFDLN